MGAPIARAELKGKLIPGKKPPFGLLWGDAEKSHLVAGPATGPLLVRMFAKVANGGSTTGVAKAFTAEGVPTTTGLLVPWRQTTITKILRNPIYTGQAEAFCHKRSKGKGRKRDGSPGKVVKLESSGQRPSGCRWPRASRPSSSPRPPSRPCSGSWA